MCRGKIMHKLNEYLLDLSPEFLLDFINNKSTTKVEFEKVVLTSVPKKNGDFTDELTISPAEGSGYINEKKIAYNRVHIDIVIRTVGNSVVVDFDTTSIHTALPSIAKRYGIYIDPSEVNDAPLTFNESGEATASIVATEKSLCIYGDSSVTFKRAKPALSNIITDGTLPKPTMYRETSWKNPVTETRYYTGDYTAVENTLRSYSKGSRVDSALEVAINSTSQRAGLQTDLTPYPSLGNGTVTYNGPIATKPEGLPTRDGFVNVMVITETFNGEGLQYIIHYGHLEKDA